MSHNGLSATGIIGSESPADLCSVQGGARAIFDCAVAVDVGAQYEESGGEVIGLLWDPTSSDWNNASWVQNRLQLTYTETPGGPMQPPLLTFDFQDNDPVINPPSWDPQGGFEASLQATTQNGRSVWSLVFKSGSSDPPQDAGSAPATGPDSVYPYWMQAIEDAAAASINGVLQIDSPAVNTTKNLIGMQGVRAQAAASGLLQDVRRSCPIWGVQCPDDDRRAAHPALAAPRIGITLARSCSGIPKEHRPSENRLSPVAFGWVGCLQPDRGSCCPSHRRGRSGRDRPPPRDVSRTECADCVHAGGAEQSGP